MYNGNTVSLKRVLWRVLNHPLAQEVTYEEAAEFAVEAIRLIGAPLAYENKTTKPPIKVSDHKALAPSNIILIRGIRAFPDNNFFEDNAYALTHATDIYLGRENCNTNTNCPLGNDLSYTIQGRVVTTSFQDGYIEIAYQGLALDEDGFPLIPDNQEFLLAIEYYTLYRCLEGLYDIGKITDKAFGRIEQNKLFYMTSAESSMQLNGYDHAIAMVNAVNRLIVNDRAHTNFFKGAGKQEIIKRYF